MLEKFIHKLLLIPLLFLWLIMKLGEFVRKFILVPLKLVLLLFKTLRAIDKSKLEPIYPKIPALKVPHTIKVTPPVLPKRLIPSTPILALTAIVVIGLFFLYSLLLITISHNLPSPEKLSSANGPLTTEFYDKDGNLLYRLYEGKNRTLIKLDDLPPYLVKATIAIEDKNFYAHPGIDMLALGRATLAYIEAHQVQGASTITQQLIKNTLLTPERTPQRKLKEILLAFWAERIFSKQDILQMYFNEVPFGGPAWGIAAAAQTYFNKEVKDLSLAESTYLAGLPASPTTYSPYGTHPELGKLRQKEVLRRMVEDGVINKDQAQQTEQEHLNIRSPNIAIKAPHFVMFARQLLAQKYGEKTVSQGGLKIYTSLDSNIQSMAEKVVSEEVEKLASLNVSNGAAMITDATTGHILAMVGSKNYYDPGGGNFNVTTALRQPGSSIKPATYATAFKQGFSPGTVLLDAPVVFKNQWESYAPVNYDGRFHGPVTIRTSLGSSYNVPAVKMLSLVGIPNMLKTAQDMGITTFTDPSRYGLSLTLGGGDIRLIDMVAMYGTFSQLGVRFDPQAILKVVDSQGIVLEDNTKPEGQRVIPSAIAYMITDILADEKARTPAFGPNSLLNIKGHTVAVKTGTTDNKRDNWTYGYTPNLVVGVWVGNNDNSPMNPALTSGVTGAAPIWNRLINNLLQDAPNIAFKRPDEVGEGIVDGHKDLIVKGQVPKSIVGLGKKRIENEGQPQQADKEPKEAITFTDPFSTVVVEQHQTPPTTGN